MPHCFSISDRRRSSSYWLIRRTRSTGTVAAGGHALVGHAACLFAGCVLVRKRQAGRLSLDGYEFDTGPTVLTLPDLLADLVGAVGEELDDWVTLDKLDPAYRARFADRTWYRYRPRASEDDTAAIVPY